jgi:hypothetical protein
MVATFENNEIAAGYDNTSGLVNIETIKVDSVYLCPVDDFGKWSDGAFVRDGETVLQPQGYASTRWDAGFITLAQWYYLYTNILRGKRSGKVTIRTRRYEADYTVICNAVLDIGDPPALTKGVNSYLPFSYRFTRIQVIEVEHMYGAIYCTEASTAQADVTTTPVIMTAFAADGLYSGTTPSHAANTITVLYAGIYRIDFHVSATITASQQFIFHLRVNAVETAYSCQFVSNALVTRNASMTAFISLSVNDVVSCYVESNDADAGTSLTVTDAQLSVQRVALS